MSLKDLAFTHISLTELEALRAEVVRLTTARELMQLDAEKYRDEVERLKSILATGGNNNAKMAAEVARLTECLDTMNAGARIHFDERKELHAEIERLHEEHKSLGAHLAHLGSNNDNLRAEIERLQIENNDRVTKLLAEIVALCAANETLRAQLEAAKSRAERQDQ